jgi:hypothetical protein
MTRGNLLARRKGSGAEVRVAAGARDSSLRGSLQAGSTIAGES